jgi:hypothetical protein
MYYKIKVSNKKEKGITTYFTDAIHFAEAAKKVIQLIGNDFDVEEIKLMKNIKPSINEKTSDKNKLYMIKIAEDIIQDDGIQIKTIKYELPCFANNTSELTDIINDYIKQGLQDMRLTTISETKWIYI